MFPHNCDCTCLSWHMFVLRLPHVAYVLGKDSRMLKLRYRTQSLVQARRHAWFSSTASAGNLHTWHTETRAYTPAIDEQTHAHHVWFFSHTSTFTASPAKSQCLRRPAVASHVRPPHRQSASWRTSTCDCAPLSGQSIHTYLHINHMLNRTDTPHARARLNMRHASRLQSFRARSLTHSYT